MKAFGPPIKPAEQMSYSLSWALQRHLPYPFGGVIRRALGHSPLEVKVAIILAIKGGQP